MFSDCLTSDKVLVLSSELESEFANIVGDGTFKGDNFALAMARLLLKPRVTEKDTVTVKVVDPNHTAWSTWAEDGKQFIDEISMKKNAVMFCVWDKVERAMTVVNMLKSLSGWEEYTTRELSLIGKQLGISLRVFRNNERKSTVVFTNTPGYESWHYLTCLFNVFYPWGVRCTTETEQGFVKTLFGSRGTDKTYKAMNDMVYNIVDVDIVRKKYYLCGYEGKLKNIQRRRYADQMEDIMRRINEKLNGIRELYKQYNEKALVVEAIDNNISNGNNNNELMNYFLSNKNITVESGDDDGKIVYVVTGYMTLFDPEVAQEYINNGSSIMYSELSRIDGSFFSKERIRKLMTEIFVESNIKIRMCSAWKISFGGCVLPVRHFSYRDKYKSYFPNPHLDKYGCLGGWQQVLEESCDKLDYVYAVDMTCAENGNLNLSDTVVLRGFLSELFRRYMAVLELPNGQVVDSIAAVKWMEGDDGSNG
jgi:hypothetical protein